MEEADRIHYSLDIRDLGPRGLEVVVTVVNQDEETLEIRKGMVAAFRDGQDLGVHAISFKGERPNGVLRIDQYEIAEGHCHIAGVTDPARLRFSVQLDCRHGASEETARITRRIETGAIHRRPGRG